MYLKRQKMRKFWPVPRKGTKYLAVALHEKKNSIPLVVVLRDILKFVKNKREILKLIRDKKISVNWKIIKEANYPIMLFDCISFPSIKKNYRAVFRNKKIAFDEISEKHSERRNYRIIGKKMIGEKIIQLSLNGGRNLRCTKGETANVGEFVIFNLKENKVEKFVSLKKGSKIVVINGKHIGTHGEIENINEEGHNKIAEISSVGREKIKVNIQNLFLIGGSSEDE